MKPVRAAVCTHPNHHYFTARDLRRLSLQNELQEPEGVLGLAVLPVPPHYWYLRPGAMGKIHLQLHPLLRHRHGDLHLLCVCTHPRAAGTGVFLRYFWGPARKRYGTDELKPTEQHLDKGFIQSTPYHNKAHEYNLFLPLRSKLKT